MINSSNTNLCAVNFLLNARKPPTKRHAPIAAASIACATTPFRSKPYSGFIVRKSNSADKNIPAYRAISLSAPIKEKGAWDFSGRVRKTSTSPAVFFGSVRILQIHL